MRKFFLIMGIAIFSSFSMKSNTNENNKFIYVKSQRSAITVNVKASNPDDEKMIWIDLNNNGKRDRGEDITVFGKKVKYPITDNEVRIYGPVFLFNCDGNAIVNIDIQNASDLSQLYCSRTKITSLDISKNAKLKNVSCYDTSLKELKLDPAINKLLNKLTIYNAGLTEEAINDIIESLPDRMGKSTGEFVVHLTAADALQEGQNKFTRVHSLMLKNKNWEAYVGKPSKALFSGPYSN